MTTEQESEMMVRAACQMTGIEVHSPTAAPEWYVCSLHTHPGLGLAFDDIDEEAHPIHDFAYETWAMALKSLQGATTCQSRILRQ